MTESSIRRYKNLITNIRNWPAYFTQKAEKSFMPFTLTTRTGITFEVPTKALYLVFKEIFMTDFYDVDDWVDSLPLHPVVVDVGANAGYFSILMMSRRPDASVFAFEPIERNYLMFSECIKRNVGLSGHVHLFHRAVTGTPVDEITLYKESDSENSVTASVFKDFESHNLTPISVKAISLSDILSHNSLGRVDLLKLDCEGSEYPILYESDPSIWKKISAVFLEVHNLDQDRRNLGALKAFLQQQGYQMREQLANNGCYALYAHR